MSRGVAPVEGNSFVPIEARAARRCSAPGHVAALALLAAGGALVLSALVDLTGGADDLVALMVCGLVSIALGGLARWQWDMPARVLAGSALNSSLAGIAALISVSTVVYLVTGAFDDPGDAIFESTAGFTTTALTAATNPESLGRGVLFWRALTQWIGAYSALAIIIAVLPFLGVGGPKATEARASVGASHLFSPHMRRLLNELLGLYMALTVVGVVLFLVGGMAPFDAITYSLTTISTGGFGNHGDSFAHFDSDLVEWAGAGGMFLGGLSLALVLRLLRGAGKSILRSTELRMYLVVVVLGSALISIWTAPSGGMTHESVRHSVFSVVSVTSTTGHWVADWGAWSDASQALILAFMGVGAMAGSMGGGFRIARALTLLSYLWRELLRQLQPRTVRVVRAGRTIVDDDLVDRMIGYQVLYLVVCAVGAFGLALAGGDVLTSISGSVSAIATVGPALGELSPGRGAVGTSGFGRAVLILLMLCGRLEIYPALNFVGQVLDQSTNLIGRAFRSRRKVVG